MNRYLIPAQNITAEKYILGTILAENSNIELTACLDEEDFYREGHRIIFKAILDYIDKKGEMPNGVRLWNFLKEKICVDDIGGFEYFHSITKKVFHNQDMFLSAIADVRIKAQTRRIEVLLDEKLTKKAH